MDMNSSYFQILSSDAFSWSGKRIRHDFIRPFFPIFFFLKKTTQKQQNQPNKTQKNVLKYLSV